MRPVIHAHLSDFVPSDKSGCQEMLALELLGYVTCWQSQSSAWSASVTAGPRSYLDGQLAVVTASSVSRRAHMPAAAASPRHTITPPPWGVPAFQARKGDRESRPPSRSWNVTALIGHVRGSIPECDRHRRPRANEVVSSVRAMRREIAALVRSVS